MSRGSAELAPYASVAPKAVSRASPSTAENTFSASGRRFDMGRSYVNWSKGPTPLPRNRRGPGPPGGPASCGARKPP